MSTRGDRSCIYQRLNMATIPWPWHRASHLALRVNDYLMEFVDLKSSWPPARVDRGSELPRLAHFRARAGCVGCVPGIHLFDNCFIGLFF